MIPKLFYSSHKQLCHFTNKCVMGQHLDLKGFTSILLECNSFAVKTIHHKNEPQKYIGKSKHTHISKINKYSKNCKPYKGIR